MIVLSCIFECVEEGECKKKTQDMYFDENSMS
jgi:hypothetical protein